MKKNIRFFVRVSEGERFPRGYGFCYFDCKRDLKMTCPVPFNFLVPGVLRAWSRLVQGRFPRVWVLTMKEAQMVRDSRRRV